MKEPVPRLDYCQSLLVSQINYTLTNFADHGGRFRHDAITRYFRGERIPPRLVWANGRNQGVATVQGDVVFDDTVLDKNASSAIALVRYQYSGNANAVLKGIGVVTGVYVHPGLDQFWLIDYRLYEPAGDGKTQLDHVRERLIKVVHQKPWPFQAVLMDTWDATKDLMRAIEGWPKVDYCPVKANRQVDDSGGQRPYGRVDALDWNADERVHGKRIKIKGCPNDSKVRRFRVEGSTHRTDWIVTNDPTQDSTAATRAVGGLRWKIEQVHRAGKPVTGLERGQWRQARIQRNHIGCAFLVWVRLKDLAVQTGRTVYQLKQGLLDEYLIYQLKNPSLKMVLA